MKIQCTIKEFATIIRTCDNIADCDGCVLEPFCPGLEHIEDLVILREEDNDA